MNALAANFALFTETLEKFARIPLAQDFFEWAEEGEWPKIRWSLSALGVSFTPSMPLSDLKARIERKLETETRNGESRHWSFDANRLVTWRQLLRAIDKYGHQSAQCAQVKH